MRLSATPKFLSVFSLVMITAGSVDNIRNLPATALFGSSLIFFFLIGAIFFLIPCAMVSGELASGWPKQGGIYIWVKEAFGERTGFAAIWLQWIENVVWYPTILSFVAGTLGYLISPNLINNKAFLVAVILCSFWGTTLINLLGMKSSAWFSNFCGIFGLLVPMGLVMLLGSIWFMTGRPTQISLAPHHLLPNFKDPTLWVSLTGIMLSFCGMEIATVHARDVRDPQKSFPRALFYSTLIILATLMVGSLAIALVVPNAQISLVAGNMQAFTVFFSAYHMKWILPVIALFLVISGLGSVSNWIIAPTKGLLVAAQDGNLPRTLQKENRFGAPTKLLIYQAIIVSVLCTVFLLLPSVNASYWLLTALTSQLYMIMYILMFAAGIKLRHAHPNQERLYRIPGGKIWGMWLVGGAGILGSVATIIVGFFPPAGIQIGNIFRYETLLIAGLVIMCLPPFIAYQFKRKSWLSDEYSTNMS